METCVRGTAYEDGWYLPAIAELYEIGLNFDTVKAANDLCGGDEFYRMLLYNLRQNTW